MANTSTGTDNGNSKERPGRLTRAGEYCLHIIKNKVPPGRLGHASAIVIVLVMIGGFFLSAMNFYRSWSPLSQPKIALVGPPATADGYVDWDPVLRAIVAKWSEAKDGPLARVKYKLVEDAGSEEASKQVARNICADKEIVAPSVPM
jgi:hypothetical protein